VELVVSICIGVGLSAACGFRVFVPMLVMSIAALSGYYTPSGSLAWVGTYPALLAFGLATAVEIAGYYVPWVDNLLDAIAFPASVIAGTLCMASAVADLSPLMTWSVAVIVGGGSAATIQGLTTVVRGASTATTGGLANPVVSTGETVMSTVLSVLAIVIPILAFLVVSVLLLLSIRKILRWRRKRAERAASTPGAGPA
jgi:large-conductance mechanosensitive channel